MMSKRSKWKISGVAILSECLTLNGAKKFPAPQEGSKCRDIKQTYYEKTGTNI